MYELDYSNTFKSTSGSDKHFNTFSITEPFEFIDKYGRELASILHTRGQYFPNSQSVATEMPFFSNHNLTEGTVVTLSDFDADRTYLGFIETIAIGPDERTNVRLSDDDAFISVHAFCSYDSSEDQPMDPKQKSNLEFHRYKSIDILCEKFKTTSLEEEFTLESLSVISDEHLAELMGCEDKLVPLKI